MLQVVSLLTGSKFTVFLFGTTSYYTILCGFNYLKKSLFIMTENGWKKLSSKGSKERREG